MVAQKATKRQSKQKSKRIPQREPTPESSLSEEEQELGNEEDVVIQVAEDEDSDIEMMEKDATELELEKLVFGDSAGFKEGIKGFKTPGLDEEDIDSSGERDDAGSDVGLGGVADTDLFFLDSGPNDTAQALVPISQQGEVEEEARDPPAWEDSDDERLMVSLAAVPRLRKLRTSLDEDVINGREYMRRLQQQFERLYPVPEWANPSSRRPAKKRRRMSGAGSSDEPSSDDDMDVDNEISAQPLADFLRNADALTMRSDGRGVKRRKLRPEVIDIQRLKDIGSAQPSSIDSLSFHPTLPLLLSSGPSSTLYLHHTQPTPPNPNPLLTSLHIKRTPLTTTAFHPSPSDARIFLSARRKYFHIWNLVSGDIEKVSRVYGHQHEQRSMERLLISPNEGRFIALLGSERKGGGVVNFLDAKSLQWISQARLESQGGIADFRWWGDGTGVSIVGKNGEVMEWDVVGEKAVARWQDEGAVGTTTLAVGGRSGKDDFIGGDRWVAIGSSSGIVNIYDRKTWIRKTLKGEDALPNASVPARPSPTKILDNLTTPISHLHFSPDGQLLVMASRWKKDALRIVHLPSCTVYRNWPTSGTPLGRISSVAWGKPPGNREDEVGGEMDADGVYALLAVGNEQGRIRLWEVRG